MACGAGSDAGHNASGGVFQQFSSLQTLHSGRPGNLAMQRIHSAAGCAKHSRGAYDDSSLGV